MVPRVPILGRGNGRPAHPCGGGAYRIRSCSDSAAGGGEYYALRIRGDSMTGRHPDGDLVIVRQDAQARSGDIVIALLEDEATCKR